MHWKSGVSGSMLRESFRARTTGSGRAVQHREAKKQGEPERVRLSGESAKPHSREGQHGRGQIG